MALTYHPQPGTILLCDFSAGFKEPEMIKSKRPVIVLPRPNSSSSSKLVTIVPLSTVKPHKVMSYHFLLANKFLPQTSMFHEKKSWVKGDMIYTVGFHRLDLIKLGKKDKQTGKRVYYTNRLSRDNMKEILKCVLNGLALGKLVEYL